MQMYCHLEHAAKNIQEIDEEIQAVRNMVPIALFVAVTAITYTGYMYETEVVSHFSRFGQGVCTGCSCWCCAGAFTW